MTIADSLTYATAQKTPLGDVVEAIGRMISVLKCDAAMPAEERIGLRFLIHLVGDLHQPLHMGRGDDNGGNDLHVRWFKKGSNLHRVWDSGMIDGPLLSYTELSNGLDHASRQPDGKLDVWRSLHLGPGECDHSKFDIRRSTRGRSWGCLIIPALAFATGSTRESRDRPGD